MRDYSRGYAQMQTQTHLQTQIKDIPGYEGLYGADTDGNIYSYNYNHTGKIGKLKPGKLPQGYLFVGLCKNKTRKLNLIHRLIADTFIPNIENKPQVNHKNGIKDDNRLVNLERCTAKENVYHAFYNNLVPGQSIKPVKGISVKTGEEIIFKSTREAGRNGFNSSTVSACCRGKRKTHKGYKWTYITNNTTK